MHCDFCGRPATYYLDMLYHSSGHIVWLPGYQPSLTCGECKYSHPNVPSAPIYQSPDPRAN